MMAKNSSSSIYPSPSLSNSSIIAINYYYLKLYPNYFATFLRSFNDIFPLLSVSNNLKAFNASSIGSLYEYFLLIISTKS
jgi:hypothetical protein